MCGIVGYAGAEGAAREVYKGLKRLEYRGYDSAGMAVMDGGKVTVLKRSGRVEKLYTFAQNAQGGVAIGHTRWATHGAPSDINAHPHTAGKITVVHNGIIENYAELKADLTEGGAEFVSDTDSEVAAHLINKFYRGDLLEALIKCANMLTGSYALLVICEDKEEIAVAKRRSPVILGRGKNYNMCASDLPALAGLCPEVCVPDDGDFALIDGREIRLFGADGSPKQAVYHKNPALPSDCDKGGYPHFMIKEIFESPAAVKRTAEAFYKLRPTVKRIISGADGLIFTGCGTAYHAALLGQMYAEEWGNVFCRAELAGELKYKNLRITPNTVLVAVTQSGETADTVEAAEKVKAAGGRIIAVTNCPYSRVTRVADCVIPVCAGAEICVAATKSYVAQLAALYLFALCFADDVTAERQRRKLCLMPRIMERTLFYADIYALADMCAHSSGVYFLGRGYDYPSALEGSLKLKEVSYVPGGGFSAGELKHGTLALIDGSALCVFAVCDKSAAAKSAGGIEQALSRGGRAAIITCLPEIAKQFKGRAEILTVPECDKMLAPLTSALIMQLAAYRTATLLGRDPDMPRNLAKSVTVE